MEGLLMCEKSKHFEPVDRHFDAYAHLNPVGYLRIKDYPL